MKCFIEVHIPGGASERHELGGNVASIGTGPHSTIRLSEQTGLAAKLMELVPQHNGVLMRPAADSPVVFNGTEHGEVFVPWGGEVYVGRIRLTVLGESGRARGGSPVLLLTLTIVLLLLGLSALYTLEPPSASAREVAAPPLVTKPPPCAANDGAAALHRAQRAEALARAKQERFPFARSEGAEALRLLQEASACYRQGAQHENATRVTGELERWTGRMNEEYAALRLRLRVSVEQDRHADALDAVKALEKLLGPQREPTYVEWLRALRRELERKVLRGA